MPKSLQLRVCWDANIPRRSLIRAGRICCSTIYDIFGIRNCGELSGRQRNLEDVGRVGQDSGRIAGVRRTYQSKGTAFRWCFNSFRGLGTSGWETEVRLPEASGFVEVVDAAGKPVASQVLSAGRGSRRVRLLLRAGVPAFGYSTYYVRAALKRITVPAMVTTSEDTLENEFVRLKVDAKTGCMTSLLDKRIGAKRWHRRKPIRAGPGFDLWQPSAGVSRQAQAMGCVEHRRGFRRIIGIWTRRTGTLVERTMQAICE